MQNLIETTVQLSLWSEAPVAEDLSHDQPVRSNSNVVSVDFKKNHSDLSLSTHKYSEIIRVARLDAKNLGW